ncbi:M1 family metallopeptidase [Sediminitomix flava]|uniref:Peptidase M1 membrane alanine aminopeptidase domain-containing protein n=1 Tax=Sediminitomix flava TaxID=379075 RepID=A0A315ZG72_SEDFL|nr:M1 family metallopeptidase [Sediminitomix flava]PWJ44153.1 hypothetical protein BC781_101503 [Sediminitomix flava]
MKKNLLLFASWALTFGFGYAQSTTWQQAIDYKMDIDFDVNTHRYDGEQEATLTNNSPDTLTRVFYHLYFNAFQPGSMMDVRSRSIKDPDHRVKDRISHLSEDEIGYQRINSLKQNGKVLEYKVEGTILEVELAKPIAPGEKATFKMDFEAQVPVQIRRSGRYNKEGVAYSMAQWYPKMCNYDAQGWHANPYVGREFYGIWGDFDVKISIDEKFVVASTGYIQNPKEVGYGYEGVEKGKAKNGKIKWHFVAPNVHDFTWAADPDFTHDVVQMKDGPALHLFYKKNMDQKYIDAWKKLPEDIDKVFTFLNENYGKYPYDVYNVVQGGDGGMEYAMLTLVTGQRNYNSLLGVTIHELLHSWYQFVLASNESLYSWMDEGFNTYVGNEVDKHVFNKSNVHLGIYKGYQALVESGQEEPLSTHADHFNTNRAYSIASYVKGAVFLEQMGYVIGKENLNQGMLNYYNTWKFKHPDVNSIIRVMEKQSGIELDWYKEYFVFTTKTIDYAIRQTFSDETSTTVTLERIGKMPMPIDLEVEYTDGSKEIFYIPLRVMRGEKPVENDTKRTQLNDWPWTHPSYTLTIPTSAKNIKKIEIDPSLRMADIDRSNNSVEFQQATTGAGI